MELLQLHYFRTVAKWQHMTKAAQELRIAQPALSKTIARLEEDVGVPLFDRERGRIRLNTFGKAYLERVDKALNLLEEGQKVVSDLAGMEHGRIHLATSTLDLLSEPLGKFLALHPDVHFQITQATIEEMATLLESGEVDICFTHLPIRVPDILTTPVLKEDIHVAVPRTHRLAKQTSIRLSELAEESFIGYREDFPIQMLYDQFFQKAGITPKFACRVDDPGSIQKLVRAGLGIALYGCINREEDPHLVMVPIKNPICQRHFQMIRHEKRYLSLAARKFCDFIIQYFAESLDK
ncbi:LysR family transcriptional regulator [Brevibacillus antibioticus]|uniref:LysR family transcriptional regulator n=1 Tax=Brevibacillus antibioticus TaxID=2570228 RepID=A0A4U2YB14_9BACL|nr:LysR substrate-binding domain-containing protein [Brevibacillus antibioticus]TKI57162.1 LysR family transcriptional regulator [Brevibacillus antibioticus]